MAEPKKRLTSTRSGNRQSHDSIKEKTLIFCPNCKKKIRPHHVCPNCGFYQGKKVIKLKDEKKKEKKLAEKLKDE
jgi:large subunit ribosomal protein L32